MTNPLLSSWELLDGDTREQGTALLTAQAAGDGSKVFICGGQQPVLVMSLPDETVRTGAIDGLAGAALVVAEDAGGRQRVVRAERDEHGCWSPAGTLPLPAGTVLDLDIDAGILLAVPGGAVGDVDVLRFDTDGANPREVYSEGGWVFTGSLSPDGTQAALLRVADGSLDTELLLCRTGFPLASRELIPHAEPAAMGRPCWAAGDETLILCANIGREYAEIVAIEVETGIHTSVWAGDYDMDVRLTADAVVLWQNVGGRSRVTRPDIDGCAYLFPEPGIVRTPRRLVLDGDGGLYCTFSSPNEPPGVWRLSTHSAAQRLSPDPGCDELAELERITVTAGDQVTVPALIWPAEPPNGAAAVILHGGPEDQWRWDHYPLIYALRRLGITVVTPDLRGSTGFGKRFYGLDDGVHHVDAQLDLDAVHACLPALGLDPKASVLIGFSFGGYQTLLGLTQRSRVWSAAVVVSGISDPLSYLAATAAYRRPHRELTYGSLERDRDFLERISPARNAAKVQAPLLLIHGELDPVVPVAQARRMAELVQAAGGDVQLNVLPGEGHQLRKRSSQALLITWVTEFLQSRSGGK
jgi:pimeloyl-ACP methyl ester carboxylesterase